jgi:hypothetical protein
MRVYRVPRLERVTRQRYRRTMGMSYEYVLRPKTRRRTNRGAFVDINRVLVVAIDLVTIAILAMYVMHAFASKLATPWTTALTIEYMQPAIDASFVGHDTLIQARLMPIR